MMGPIQGEEIWAFGFVSPSDIIILYFDSMMNLQNYVTSYNHCCPGGSCDVSSFPVHTHQNLQFGRKSQRQWQHIPKKCCVNSALDGTENHQESCVKTWMSTAEWTNTAEEFSSECKEDLEIP